MTTGVGGEVIRTLEFCGSAGMPGISTQVRVSPFGLRAHASETVSGVVTKCVCALPVHWDCGLIETVLPPASRYRCE